MAEPPSHHRIYGTCIDFVTGEQVTDTDDERYRQKLARFLVEQKGFAREELELRRTIETLFGGQFVTSRIEVVVRVAGRRLMLLRYGPGSLVTRERPAIAAARVLEEEQQIPLAVVTNGEDAELLETARGKVLRQGMAGIPGREEIIQLTQDLDFSPYPAAKRERELRILNAFDVEVCCAGGPCPLPEAPEG